MNIEPIVKSEWLKINNELELFWSINDELISDKELRLWCYHNIEGVDQYVDVIRWCHTNAYAKRARNQGATMGKLTKKEALQLIKDSAVENFKHGTIVACPLPIFSAEQIKEQKNKCDDLLAKMVAYVNRAQK